MQTNANKQANHNVQESGLVVKASGLGTEAPGFESRPDYDVMSLGKIIISYWSV